MTAYIEQISSSINLYTNIIQLAFGVALLVEAYATAILGVVNAHQSRTKGTYQSAYFSNLDD